MLYLKTVSTGQTRIRQREVYPARYYRTGHSYVVTIPPDVRELMKLLPGDCILMNCDQGVLYMVKADKGMVINREKATAIFEKLFADKEPKDGRNA